MGGAQRSDTHRILVTLASRAKVMGLTALYPSYGLIRRLF
jgi:hypothetical protein